MSLCLLYGNILWQFAIFPFGNYFDETISKNYKTKQRTASSSLSTTTFTGTQATVNTPKKELVCLYACANSLHVHMCAIVFI